MNKKNYLIEKSEDLDREEYFGSGKDTYNSLYPSDRYPMTNGQSTVKATAMFGLRPNLENEPEPPPRINRANKPNRFRSAHERLFGRPISRELDNTPDYINTTMPAQTPIPSNSKSISNSHANGVNSRVNYMDNSSYSSDSYKYGSPIGTLDDKKYGSLTSANSTLTLNSRPFYDPYTFNRANPQSLNNSTPEKQNGLENRKITSNPSHTQFGINSNGRLPPPSPPLKPSNYQSM